MQEFRLGELFCGPGGLGFGADLARVKGAKIRHTWATDFDKDACETYAKNLNLSPKSVLVKDVRELDFERLDDIGEVNALAFGFPCNDFSMVGKKHGRSGIFGSLYRYCVQAVEHCQPSWFIAENVGGLRSSDEGSALQSILQEFSGCGYRLYPHLYKFDQYGVPQSRQRIIIVGIREDLKVDFKVPSPEPFKNMDVSAKTALLGIKNDAFNHELTKQSEVVVERLKHIKPGQNAFSATMPEELKLNVNGAKISQIYRRLMANRPAYTVTGSGGGGTHVYHWEENRALTNRERARLQTFPDDFIFYGGKESVRKQIGMAVSPAMAKIIFEAILKSFLGVDYPHVPANMQSSQSPQLEMMLSSSA